MSWPSITTPGRKLAGRALGDAGEDRLADGFREAGLTCGNACEPVSTHFHSLTQPTSTLAPVKVREVIHMLEQDGWQQVVQRGRHRQFRHPAKPGRVTVAGKPSEELAPGTLGSILRQSGLSKE